MIADIRIEHVAAHPLAVVRRAAPQAELSHVVPASMGAVWNILRAAGLRGGRNVAVYLDCGEPARAITMDIGVEIDPHMELPDGLVAAATPAGAVATVTHLGPYNQLHAPHAAIREFCEAHDHRYAGPNWEIYGHWLPEWEHNPGLIRTDVFYLLAPSTSSARTRW